MSTVLENEVQRRHRAIDCESLEECRIYLEKCFGQGWLSERAFRAISAYPTFPEQKTEFVRLFEALRTERFIKTLEEIERKNPEEQNGRKKGGVRSGGDPYLSG